MNDRHADIIAQPLHQVAICAWMVTSRAVVGSSAIRLRVAAQAMAIMTRWRMPRKLMRIIVGDRRVWDTDQY
jgi:hypothetical protein